MRRHLFYALSLLTVLYGLVGFYCLLGNTSFSYPIDLRIRWIEQKLVWAGVNPLAGGHPEVDLPKTHLAMKNMSGGYPPWSYATGMLFYPPLSWEALKWHYGILCFFSIGLIAWWMWRLDLSDWPGANHVAVVSFGAMFPMAICISYGQHTLLVSSCLVLSLWMLHLGRDTWAGILLGLALTKPQLAGLFVLVYLFRRKYRALACMILYVAAASGLTWFLVGVDPLTMLKDTSQEVSASSKASLYLALSINPLTEAVSPLLGAKLTIVVLGISGVVAAVILLFVCRRNDTPLLIDFSICAILSMYWASYRKNYDGVLLLFPLVGLLWSWHKSHSGIAGLMYVLFGISLWLPIRDTQWASPAVKYGDLVVWCAALFGLVWWSKPKNKQDVGAPAVPSSASGDCQPPVAASIGG